MAKVMQVTDANGMVYTLEYTRKTVQMMESKGFDIGEASKKPATHIPMWFHGAFVAHHPTIKQTTTDDILATIGNKEGLFATLGEMYTDPIQSLLGEPENTEGNATWSANW